MNFLPGKGSGENILVLDIASGSTSAALVRTHSKAVPEMLAQMSTPFSVPEKPTKGPLEAAMLLSLRSALTSIASRFVLLRDKGYGSSIDKVLVTFSSPWTVSHLKTVIIEREKNFVFDHSTLRGIVAEEKELFVSKLRADFEEESDVFESVVTGLYLNGYATTDLVSHKVSKAEVSFLLSATSKDLLWKIENELLKTTHVKKGLALHSFMYVFYKVLTHAFQSLHSALLINMTSEVTDILFIRHGSSALSASLPFGPSAIARAVAARLGIPLELAHSYLSIFASGAFDEETSKAVDEALVEIEARWTSLWKNMGESIPEGSSVPYSVFLVVPPGYERLMKTFLESVLGGRSVVLLGETSTFTKELVQTDVSMLGDEKMMVLSSFSNIMN